MLQSITRRHLLQGAAGLSSVPLPAIGAPMVQVPEGTVRDRLWIFTAYAGASNNSLEIGDVRGGSRMTPAEGAYWLGVPNLLFIRVNDIPDQPNRHRWRAQTEFEQYMISFEPLDRVVWSATGSGGVGALSQLQPFVLPLAKKFPNFTGVFFDDFIIEAKPQPDGRIVGRPAWKPEELQRMREQLGGVGRPLETWVTLYTQEINPARKTKVPAFKDCEPPLATFLDQFDVLTLWTWNSEELPELEANMAALEKIKPVKSRIALGIYIFDYHNHKPVPVELMKHQCDLGLKWLKEGRISDMIFLANTVLDVGLPSAEFSREWIKKHGGEKLNREAKR